MRFILVVVLFFSVLFAKESNTIEIFATTLQQQQDKIILNGDVFVVYGDYILSAKRAKYNRKSAILELFENVKVTKQGNYKILGKYAKIDLAKKKRVFKPFYMLEEKLQVWLSSEGGEANCNNLDIEGGVVSGCDPLNPLWQIEFSSSDYNAKTKWLNLYNMVLYIYDVPVLYTPYFGYSLDTTRRTGLLTPSFGYSSDEGLFYEQPIYIAEQNWWDLEFDPQIRTNRGKGIYATFRFVDSAYSKGSVTAGYFKEDEDYFRANQLANKEHYGIDVNYENSDFLYSWFDLKTPNQSVIFLESTNLNDVDYINLATNDTTQTITASQTISRLNVFYNTENHYFGLYAKYYTDLKKQNNKDTLQQLPTLHYHSYMDSFLQNHFLYDFDIKSTNFYRREGVNAQQTSLNLPLIVRTSLFDEYINLSYQTQLYGEYTKFSKINNPSLYKNGYYSRNYNQFNISTDLLKKYDSFIHTISFSASYIKSGFEKRSGYYLVMKDNELADPFYTVTDIQEAITLNFSQYFFDKEGKQIAYHRLSDIVARVNDGGFDFGEIESELDWDISASLKYYNDIFYNFKNSSVAKHYNKLTYHTQFLNFSVSHFYKKDQQTFQKTSYITSAIKYKYNSHYSYNGAFDYDLLTNKKKKLEVGFLYDKRCWTFGLKYAENNRPILTQDGIANSVYDRYIYFTILLKPIMKKSKSDFFGLRLPQTLSGS